MAGTETKRIIELTEASTVQSGDFIAVDSNARGTKKVSTDALATSAALTAETNARTGADEQMSERMDGIEEQTALIQNPTKTLSGALCSFTDGADMPMVACTASITPKQSGTGTPSPDNVRQISGWESVSVYDTGVNLFDKDAVSSGEWLSTSTGLEESAVNYCVSDYIPVKANNPVYIPATQTARRWFYDSKKNPTVYIGASGDQTYNPPSDGFIRVSILINGSGAVNLDTYQIEYGSAPTSYKTFGTTTPVNLGRTVYGGTLDVVSGVLTVDRAMVDLGTLDWTYDSSSNRFYTNGISESVKRPSDNYEVANSICSAYSVTSLNQFWSSTDGKYAISITGAVSIRDSRYTDATAFKTAMSGVQLVYELATPQTYTLTGQEVSTLLGDNNVWADSGDVEITYRRDISIVINNLESALNG